jgi:hypothetical protein
VANDSPRWGLPAPDEDDPVEGWLQIAALRDDLEALLGSALRVPNAAARTALGVALGTGGARLLVVQDDTSQPYLWLGASWLALGGSGGGGGGGGGGGTGTRGRWAATTAQDVASGGSVVAAFGSDLETSPDWSKVTRGAGHGFRAQRAGVVSGALNLRYATTTANGVRDVHVRKNTDYVGSSGGSAVAGQPRHHSVAILPQPIAEDDEIWVDLFNGTGATRQLEPNGGQWVQLSLVLT